MLDWQWYDDIAVKTVFLHLLLTASYKNSSWQNEAIKPGQVITSYESMNKILKIGVQKIRTAIKKLKSTGEITIESTNKYTLITIEKWEQYQYTADEPNTQINKQTNIQLTSNQQATNKQLTNNQQHIKNIKNIKNIENVKNGKKEREGNGNGDAREKNSLAPNPPAPARTKSANFEKSQKEHYCQAQTVTLTDEEYRKLLDEFGECDTAELIRLLDEYKLMTGKYYKSDFRAIKSWVKDKLAEQRERQSAHAARYGYIGGQTTANDSGGSGSSFSLEDFSEKPPEDFK